MDEVASLRELRQAGLSDTGIARRLAAGRLVRVARDAYAVPGAVPSPDRIHAAVGRGAALCRASAARAWGLPVAEDGLDLLVHHGSRHRSVGPDVRVHQSRTWRVETREGVLVTELTPTLLDLCRWSDLTVAVSAADAAVHAGLIGIEELHGAAGALGGAPGTARIRRALDLVDGRVSRRWNPGCGWC